MWTILGLRPRVGNPGLERHEVRLRGLHRRHRRVRRPCGGC